MSRQGRLDRRTGVQPSIAVPASAAYLEVTMLRRRSLFRSVLGRLGVALLALGLVVRLGGACEAMAMPVAAPVAHMAGCDQIPAKPVKHAPSACPVSCVALPDAVHPAIEQIAFVAAELQTDTTAKLAGLAGGPAPPPPRSA